MKRRKLNYRFHNPNSAADTVDYILRVFVEANREKVRWAVQARADENHRAAFGKGIEERHTV